MAAHAKSKKSPFLWALLIVLLGLLAFVVVAGIYIIKISLTLQQQPDYQMDDAHEEAEEDVTGLESIGEKVAEELTGGADPIKEDKDTVDVLLLGVDSRSNNFAGRSDVMLLIRVNTRTGENGIRCRDLRLSYTVNQSPPCSCGGPDLALPSTDIPSRQNICFIEPIIDSGRVVRRVEESLRPCSSTSSTGYSSRIRRSGSGPQRLDGVQATAYMRNRKSGTDSARTGRQRTVLMALLRSLGGVELTRLPGLVDTGVNYLRTNIPLVDLPGYATTLMGMSDAQVGQMVVPEPYKNVNYNDMAVVIMEDPEAEISELHAFLLD